MRLVASKIACSPARYIAKDTSADSALTGDCNVFSFGCFPDLEDPDADDVCGDRATGDNQEQGLVVTVRHFFHRWWSREARKEFI